MRGKWLLAMGAVLALVVIGAVGGMTVRAFAGVARGTVHTTTVTRFCVYVDRHNVGDSYGDVTVIPKYKNRVCIAGKPGNSSVITWNKTVATATPLPLARRLSGHGGPPPASLIDLAKVGPFTVQGSCFAGNGVSAVTGIKSAKDGSSLAWNNTFHTGTFNSGSWYTVSPFANGGVQKPDWVNEGNNGDFAVTTADQKTAFNGFANNGVYLNGPSGPACSFTGYLVVENPSA